MAGVPQGTSKILTDSPTSGIVRANKKYRKITSSIHHDKIFLFMNIVCLGEREIYISTVKVYNMYKESKIP